MKLVKTKKLHYKRLTKGCRQCIYGRKSVLFITSRCHYTCFYCPISDDKRLAETVKINEHVIKKPDSKTAIHELIREVELSQSKGVGVTGGDPLATPARTIKYIKALKDHFGKRFHIHLYTSPQFITRDKLEKLADAGLDEIRFHLNIESDVLWDKVNLVKGLKLLVGLEIPAVPRFISETKKLLDFCKSNPVIKFVNLNELEYSDAGIQELAKKGFFTKDSLSYAINHSEAAAEELVLYGRKINLRIHYCSAQFKDAVQLGNRLKLRAQSVVKPHELVNDEGMIVRGEIISKKKSFSSRQMSVFGLKAEELFGVPRDFFEVHEAKLMVRPDVLEEIWPLFDQVHPKKDLSAKVVVEYPTDDHMLVESHPLN